MPDILELVVGSEKNLFVGLAGPGTGKSFSFKTIVKSDNFRNKKILVLSFINKLIDDLTIDFEDFNNVEVSTLHSFAMQEYTKQTKKKVGFVVTGTIPKEYKAAEWLMELRLG